MWSEPTIWYHKAIYLRKWLSIAVKCKPCIWSVVTKFKSYYCGVTPKHPLYNINNNILCKYSLNGKVEKMFIIIKEQFLCALGNVHA